MERSPLKSHGKLILNSSPWLAWLSGSILVVSLYFQVPGVFLIVFALCVGVLFVPLLYFYWKSENIILSILIIFGFIASINQVTATSIEAIQFIFIVLGISSIGLYIFNNKFRVMLG
jgi:hypothetical protein